MNSITTYITEKFTNVNITQSKIFKSQTLSKPLLIPLMFLTLILSVNTAKAQVSLGADVVNRYVWRGFDFGNSVNIQPSISYTAGGFSVGAWGAFATDDASADENDLWIGYTFDLGSGSSIGFGATDYYFPAQGTFFDYDGNGNGAHWIEPYVSYSGPDTFPISLSASIVATNDVDFDGETANPVYLQASYPFKISDTVDMSFTFGAITSESANFYGVTDAAVTNLNISATKEIKISESFSLPINASYILNPYSEISYLVVGFSL